MDQELTTASAGDRMTGEELQSSIDTLRRTASQMDEWMTDDLSVREIQDIGRAQSRLRSLAASLLNRQIDLLAGEVRVTAEHINAAVAYADSVIRGVADRQARLAKVGALVDFFGAVVTGDGRAIVQAAVTLKSALA
jgi:hypothetical protein